MVSLPVRLLQAIPALLGVSFVAFALLYSTGDPTYVLLPPEASPEQREAFRESYGLNDPLVVQYVRFVGRLVTGDFGTSMSTREPALGMVLQRIPATLQLAATAMTIALLVAVPLGVVAAYRRGMTDRLLMTLVLIGQSVPTFWLGLIVILIFAVFLKLLPVSGRGGLEHLILPSITLAAWLLTLLARVTRSEMLEALGQEYVRTARAKGLRELSVVGHAFRNVLIPLITIVAIQFGILLGGALMTEIVFAWPGIGSLMFESILKKDYPVVLTVLIFAAIGTISANAIADIAYGIVDPRVRRRVRR
ncbi:MAG: ABC transporter permease [Chloroflexota bacterium]